MTREERRCWIAARKWIDAAVAAGLNPTLILHAKGPPAFYMREGTHFMHPRHLPGGEGYVYAVLLGQQRWVNSPYEQSFGPGTPIPD